VQAAISRNGVKSVAWKTEKSEGPFRCPGCAGEVILKKGKVKEHHYAHKPPCADLGFHLWTWGFRAPDRAAPTAGRGRPAS